jgi:tetratricopeptide (TPR) repeat protein
LLINTEAWRACQTLIRWADFLWNTRRGKEAVQILEDAVASGYVQITKDGVDRSLPPIIDELQSFHYRWAQYADPTTGVKATPEVRIEHLNRIIALGFRFGYIYKFLAEAHHDLGDDKQARAYLTQAWEIDPCLLGAVRIARALGLSAPPKSDEPALISLVSPKWTRLQQVPTESQIRQWVKDGRWDTIIQFSNPAEYSRALPPKARNALGLIAISLGECGNYEGAAEALSIMLSSFYWDIRDAAVTSLAKIGDEDTLAFLEDLSAGVNWSSFSKERLKTSIAYLRARVSGKPNQGVKPESSGVLAHALRAHDRRQYGLARFLLEGLMTEIKDGHPSYLEATVALAHSCSEMNDTEAAIEIIKPAFTKLKNVGNRAIMTDIRDWLWNNVVFEEYAEERDDVYKWGLELDLSLTLTAATPDDVLRPFRNLTRWLEMLGAGPTAQVVRELIRTEALGTLYVDKHDRANYLRKVTLSEDMRNFLEEFDTRIKLKAVVKVKEVMGSERSIEHARSH